MDAEKAVLGACLHKRSGLEAASRLNPEDFFDQRHVALFKHVQAMSTAGEPVDVVTVAERVYRAGELQTIGGAEYLTELVAASMNAAYVVRHVEIIRDLATRRRTMDQARQIFSAAANPDLEGGLSESVNGLNQILESNTGGDDGKGMAEATTEFLTRLDKESGLPSRGVPTPWPSLNRITSGFHPGEVAVLAARPGQGKTAAGLNIVVNAARHGVHCAFFSLEMDRHSLLSRIFATESGVDGRKFRDNGLSDDDYQHVYAAAHRLQGLPLTIFDESSLRPVDLTAKVRQLRRKHDVRLVAVDYMQLLKPDRELRSRHLEVAECARSLKRLALSEGISILALCQVNREVEKRKERKLGLADLRESGEIEQAADMVLFLQPWSMPFQGWPDVTLDVAKSRSTGVGSIKMRYSPRDLFFGEADQS